jgi:nucleoside-diphosphate-sugar epimerase
LAARSVDLDREFRLRDDERRQTAVYYFAPPPPAGETEPRLRRFLAALGEDRARRIVYVSTTGIYGDCGGAWVDETREPQPTAARALRRYDAERELGAWRSAGRGEVVILRVAGIYGPFKLPLERLQRREPMIAAADAPWTNRIHIDDLVSVCEAAMVRGRDGEAYNVSDGQPGNMRDYFDRVADAFGLERPPEVSLDDARAQLSAGMLSYLAESRRLDNGKMLDHFNLELRYPDLASGLADCVGQMGKPQS